MVLLDSVGLTMFVPLLQVADGNESFGAENGKLIEVVESFFGIFHLSVTVINMLILIALIFSLKALFVYYVQKYTVVTMQVMSQKIRTNLTYGLKNLSYREFVMADIGRLQNSLTGEANQVVQACRQYLETIKNGMIVAVYMGFAFLLDWRFSLLVSVGGLLTNFAYKYFYKRTKEVSQAITKNNHDFSGIVIEAINHFKYLKASGRNHSFTNRTIRVLNELVDNDIKVGKLGAVVQAMREPMLIIVICAVIAVQLMVFKTGLSAVLIILVLFYRALSYMMNLQTSWNFYLQFFGSLKNIQDFSNYLETNVEVKYGKQLVQQIEEIKLEHISLSYGDFQVLKDISLQIKRNDSIAFVGESGSGKTTLVNIICSLLQFDNGKFTVNQQPIENFSREDYRNRVGYITQEPTVFNGDIFDNITFWSERTPENIEKFWNVVEMCSLTEFINGLPHQENEMLGNNGLNISGGQKQRVSIARELFREVEILIMDEATSALDSETEQEVKESLEAIQGKVTLISIAHRLSTVRHADCLYLMDKGVIVASGHFEELKEKSDYFRRLAELQGL